MYLFGVGKDNLERQHAFFFTFVLLDGSFEDLLDYQPKREITRTITTQEILYVRGWKGQFNWNIISEIYGQHVYNAGHHI